MNNQLIDQQKRQMRIIILIRNSNNSTIKISAISPIPSIIVNLKINQDWIKYKRIFDFSQINPLATLVQSRSCRQNAGVDTFRREIERYFFTIRHHVSRRAIYRKKQAQTEEQQIQ
jgi:hypothetical protein